MFSPPSLKKLTKTPRDPCIWKLGPLSLDPLAWHHYRFALSHPLQGHKESPYDEAEAKRIGTLNIRNLPVTAPTDPLFVDTFHLKETQAAMRALNKDKARDQMASPIEC